MSRNRTQTILALIVVGFALILAAIFGLWAFMIGTARTLHPDPRRVPSVADVAPRQDWTAAVERAARIARAGLADRNLPGLSVAVGIGGEVVWAEGFGYADLDTQARVTPDTRFRIGTASPALTSAAVGLLLEQGRLSLDDEIQTHVPAFPKKPWPVTVRHLMAHTAGLRNDGGDEAPYTDHCEKPADALRIFQDARLLFEPGTRYRPSNYGWMLVSAAVEAAAEEPFYRYIRRHVFEPLGMDATRPESFPEPVADRATSYFPRFASEPRYGLHLVRPIDLSCYTGAAAFMSTPSDLVRFAMAVHGGKLLAPATVAALTAPQRLPTGEDTGYGLGWDLETATLAGRPSRVVGHDGDTLGGMVASFMTFPHHDITVAVASNISYADTFSLAVSIAEAFLHDR